MRLNELVLVLFISSAWSCLPQQDVELQPIFTGKNLDGWKPPPNNQSWTVSDGVLHVKNDAKQTGSILWTDAEYTDFILEVEFKFGSGTIDSGIFVRNDSEQIQIGISGSLQRDMTASPYIPGKGYPVEAKNVAQLLKLTDWNVLRLQATGPNYTTWLNGEKVMTYQSDSAAKTGPIGLQLHPNREMELSFRNIRLAEIN